MKDSNNNKEKSQYKIRINECNYNKDGDLMKIIKYNNSNDIWIEFQDKYRYKKNTTYKNFKEGCIKNLFFDKYGYIGNENIRDEKGSILISYYTWKNMMGRCYNTNNKNYKLYGKIGVTVCEEWHNYSNFKKWWNDNYYKIPNERMALDKDILVKGNKIYSPNTCAFVPQSINNIILINKKNRNNLPIGVSKNRKGASKPYRAKCNQNGWIGAYYTELEAFQAYKQFKESYIKQVADEYKQKYLNFPKKLYDAMYNWKIEIDD